MRYLSAQTAVVSYRSLWITTNMPRVLVPNPDSLEGFSKRHQPPSLRLRTAFDPTAPTGGKLDYSKWAEGLQHAAGSRNRSCLNLWRSTRFQADQIAGHDEH